MAEKLTFDTGVLELDINGNGLLRFNPSDPNVYRRFYELAKELPALQQECAGLETAGEDELEQSGRVLEELEKLDGALKRRLSHVFGAHNDFDALLEGVSLMSFGGNGRLVAANLLDALAPYMEEGAKRHMRDAAAGAVAEAERNREQRRARQ